MNIEDTRKNERITFEAIIEFAHEDSEYSFGAEVCNYSDGGICFETGYAIRPGSKIKISVEEEEFDASCPNIQDGCIAKVRWCKNMTGQKAFFYWVGAEFVE